MRTQLCLAALVAFAALAAAGCANSQSVESGVSGSNYIPLPEDLNPPQQTPTTSPSGSPTATPTPGPIAKGIDVSEYQGTVDWSAVKADGIDFAIIRATDGTGTIDSQFATNWAAAKSAGVIRGAYQFFRPEEDGAAQADLLLSKMGTLDPGDIPPTLDVEVTDSQTDAHILAAIANWRAEIKSAIGREPIIYTSPGFWDGLSGAPAEPETLWEAHWTSANNPDPLPSSWTAYYFWQWSDSGSVANLSPVDLDRFHGDLAALEDYIANGP